MRFFQEGKMFQRHHVSYWSLHYCPIRCKERDVFLLTSSFYNNGKFVSYLLFLFNAVSLLYSVKFPESLAALCINVIIDYLPQRRRRLVLLLLSMQAKLVAFNDGAIWTVLCCRIAYNYCKYVNCCTLCELMSLFVVAVPFLWRSGLPRLGTSRNKHISQNCE